MKTNRTKNLSVKLQCECYNPGDFTSIKDYYTYITSELCNSKSHVDYFKNFFMLRPYHELESLGYDVSSYDSMSRFVCVSAIY